MNVLVVKSLVGMLLAALAGSFALAFATPRDASRAVERIRARCGVFRVGGFAVVAGIVFAMEADAIVLLAGISRDDPRFLTTQAAGWMLIVVGVAVLDGVMWTPSAHKAQIPEADSAP